MKRNTRIQAPQPTCAVSSDYIDTIQVTEQDRAQHAVEEIMTTRLWLYQLLFPCQQ
jgi:hypothetical protein